MKRNNLIDQILYGIFATRYIIVTVRKRSLRRLCFYTCLSFCSQQEVSRPRPGGGDGGGLLGGVSRPRGCLPKGVPRPRGCPGPGLGGVSQHALRQTPPSRRLLLRTVRILLECILVEETTFIFFFFIVRAYYRLYVCAGPRATLDH